MVKEKTPDGFLPPGAVLPYPPCLPYSPTFPTPLTRRARRACEGAARGVGAPQATELGCGRSPT